MPSRRTTSASQWRGGSTVVAYFHNADGSVDTSGFFAFEDSFQGGVSIAAGDLNGDGKADLVVANFADDTLSILLGNGNGSFQSQITLATGARDTIA